MPTDYTRLTYQIRRLNKRLAALPPNEVEAMNSISEQLGSLRAQLNATPEAAQYKENRALKRQSGQYKYSQSNYPKELALQGEQLRERRTILLIKQRSLVEQMKKLAERRNGVEAELQAVRDDFLRLKQSGGPGH